MNPIPHRTLLPIEKLPTTYKLIVSSFLESKIRFLCSKCPALEWSGILFYTYTGTFESNDLVITAQDLYLMDIGSPTFTAFDMNSEVIHYMTTNPELLESQIGLLHSHQALETFFSGTDIKTLQEEGEDRNTFVSLIVNNKGTYTAAITRKVDITSVGTSTYSYPFFGEGIKDGGSTDFQVQRKKIQYFLLDIEKETVPSEPYDLSDLQERYNELNNKVKQTINPLSNLFYSTISKSKHKYKERKNESNFVLDPNIKQELLTQIYTGSVLLNSDFNEETWATQMEELFDQKFGDTATGYDNYALWAESFGDYIIHSVCNQVNPSSSLFYNEDAISDIAKELIKSLESGKIQNNYIDIWIEILSRYIF